MPNPSIDFGPLQDSDQERTFRRLASQAFNINEDFWDTFVGRVGRENMRVASDASQVVGGLAAYRLSQWFGGKSLSMAGIALVAVSAERRNQRVARRMLSALLHELHAAGTPLSVLYASTQGPYRSVGYEQAGNWYLHELPLHAIGHRDSSRPLRQVEPNQFELFQPLAEQRAARTNGNLQRTDGMWQRLIDPKGNPTPTRAYLVGDAQKPEGYVLFFEESDGDLRQIMIRDMMAANGDAASSIWQFIRGHCSLVKTVQWYGPATDPMLLLPLEDRSTVINRERWMMRIVDVERALELRGYPNAVNEQLHLQISDQILPTNDGRFTLTIHGGQASVEKGGRGDLKIDVRGLAPLYSSLFDAFALQQMGYLDGEPAVLETANRIFAGPEPWMPEMF